MYKIQQTSIKQTATVIQRYLGFMVSSATALVKFLCVIGRNLVTITGKEKYSKNETLENLHVSQSKAIPYIEMLAIIIM